MTVPDPSPVAADVERRRIFWVRWAVRGVLIGGVTASLAANMLHAEPNVYARVIAAWPPAALFATIEVISRVPVDRAFLARLRVGATIAIGAIAAWVSYWHMAAVVAHYGEHGATPYLLPLSVDGLVVIASISLFQLAGRLRELTADPTPSTASRPPADSQAAPPHPPKPTAHPSRPAPARGANNAAAGLSAVQVAARVAELRAANPASTVEEIADRVGRSPRQVRRIIDRLNDPDPTINGAARPDLLTAPPSR